MKAPSNFTICLTMVIVMIVGAALIPLIDVGIKPPPVQGQTLTVKFKWAGASPKVVEHGVTSVIEGIAAGVKGVESTESESYFGYGQIRIRLKRSANVSAVRFEIASLLRQVYHKLPEGVTYPTLSGGEVVNYRDRSNKTVTLLTYYLNANMPEEEIIKYVESVVAEKLRGVENVRDVTISGGTGRYIEITYDPQLLAHYGITTAHIATAIKNFMRKNDIIGDVMHEEKENHRIRQTLYMTTEAVPLSDIPVVSQTGHTIYLNNLVTKEIKKKKPDSFYRINGLNTISLNIKVSSEENFISLSDKLQGQVKQLESQLRKGIHLTLAYDAAAEERVEVNKLIVRSLMSLGILLLCVWMVRREWKYLLIIASTLIANILMAVIGYYLFNLKLHIFSMAGITVSFSLIIDASIVMADHYGYYHNRKAFLAILAAMLTTIGTLLTVLFLPQEWQESLYDFSRIIIINLAVSLLVALLFVPALTDNLHYSSRKHINNRKMRLVVKGSRIYAGYIHAIQKHRWVGFTVLVLAFGVPLFLLPSKLESPYGQDEPWYYKLYNNTLGTSFFRDYCKKPLQDVLGGSLKLFVESIDASHKKDEDQKQELVIRGELPSGGTAKELNDKIMILENLLRKEKGIKRFVTSVNGTKGRIVVEFEDEAASTSLPFRVESKVIGKMMGIGGADWSTWGVNPTGFSNSLKLQNRSNQIWLAGYNFDRLNAYAKDVCRYIASNERVKDIAIEVPGHESEDNELSLDYDRERMELYGIKPERVYETLSDFLQEQNMGKYEEGTEKMDLVLKPKQANDFDRWRMMNSYISIQQREVRLAELMEIDEHQSTGCIPKRNQEYILCVAFNLLGSYAYSNDYINEVKEHFNQQMSMGYKCMDRQYRQMEEEKAPYWLIAIVIVVIYFICAVLFESLWLPLVIVSLIPVSFIGLFLTFWITGTPFGTGGFASMIMLAGIVVNSAIYILNENRMLMIQNGRVRRMSPDRIYIKAYNHKIIPVLLTVLSTVLGLIPFFWDGEKEVFWHSFATGVTGGLLFSIPALILVIPLMLKPLFGHKQDSD